MRLRSERLFPVELASELEAPDRFDWLPPDEVVVRLDLSPGMRVLDLGAGIGYLSLPIARAVGATGRAVAIDLQPRMIAHLVARLAGEAASVRVVPAVADVASLPLPAATFERILLSTVWQELPDVDRALREMARVAAPGGRLLIVSWRPDAVRPPGPRLDVRITRETTVERLEANGWRVVRSAALGPFLYQLTAEPPGGGR